uniref:Uncharacterized protein n=1 Tax=Arundo donax TaxID=35708 RepID=A0A0A9B491_ARUDO
MSSLMMSPAAMKDCWDARSARRGIQR